MTESTIPFTPAASGLLHRPSAPQSTAGQHEKLVLQSRKWVAQTFYGTMLKQMRNSPFKSELFSGGRGGEAFSPLLDQRLAERMTRGPGAKLADAIVRQMEGRRAYRKSSAGQTPAPQNGRRDVAAMVRA